MDVLTKILDEMKRQKISQKTITSSLGLSQQSFSEWKAGRGTSYMKYLPQIAQILGVSVDYLLGRDPGIEKSSAENPAELEELLNSPYLRETYEKLVRMNPEELELVNAQIDLILKIRDKNPTDDARPE